MNSLENTQTLRHMTLAYMGECQGYNSYMRYAKIALKEGYRNISEQWELLAQQELTHANAIFKLINVDTSTVETTVNTAKPGTTEENLIKSIEGERKGYLEFYPYFAQVARDEGFDKIAMRFDALAIAEGYHMRTLSGFLDQIQNDKAFKSETDENWLCLKCGYVHDGNEAPHVCPACDHAKSHFSKISLIKI